MDELLSMYDKDYIEQYGLGGWMKENAGNLLTTAAGVGSMFIPGGQVAGLGMMAGGIAGMATSGQQTTDEPRETPYDDYGLRTVDQPISTSNVRPMAMGGELTEYEGPSHAQGGIKLGGIGAEVEGGEARTGDIIHSDDIKITQEILREFGKGYGGDVPITENDVGKSIADVIKSKEGKYKKYEGDKWNEMSRKAAHLPFEKMSTILADREKIDEEIADGYEQMAYGGGLMFNRNLKRDGTGPEGKGPRTGRGLGTCYESGGELPDWLYDARGEAIREEGEEDNELAKGGWIQKATKSISARGTEGVCTGSKFGGPTCRPGTRRYNLAKTFKKMNKKQVGGPLLDEPDMPEAASMDNWLAVSNWMPVTKNTMELEFGDRGMLFDEDVNEFNKTLKSAYPDQAHLPYKMEGDKYYKNFPKSFQIGEGGEKTGTWRPYLNSQTGYPRKYEKGGSVKAQGGYDLSRIKPLGFNTDVDSFNLAEKWYSHPDEFRNNILPGGRMSTPFGVASMSNYSDPYNIPMARKSAGQLSGIESREINTDLGAMDLAGEHRKTDPPYATQQSQEITGHIPGTLDGIDVNEPRLDKLSNQPLLSDITGNSLNTTQGRPVVESPINTPISRNTPITITESSKRKPGYGGYADDVITGSAANRKGMEEFMKGPSNLLAGQSKLTPIEAKGMTSPELASKTLATIPTSPNPRNGIFGGGEGQFGMNDLLGLAPIIGSAIGAGRAFKEEPEEVEYQRARYTPVNPVLMDSTQQVEDVRSAFGTANLQMRQTSPKDFLRRRTASATQEAGAIAGVRGGVQQANVGIRNRADELNARNKLYAEQMNTQIGMREQDANAANRAMDRSVEDMYLNQLFTQAGQYSRDIKMEKANKAYNERYLDIIEGERDSLGGVGSEDVNAGNISAEQSGSNIMNDYSTDIGGQGFQTGMFAGEQQGFGLNYNFNPNSNIRGINPYSRSPGLRGNRINFRRPSIRLNP